MSRVLPILLLASASTASIAAPGAADAGAERAIRAALADWVAAANRGDAKAALRVWAPDLVGWAPTGEDSNYAREAAAAERAPTAPGSPNVHYAVHVDEVMVEGGLAVVRDTWTQTTAGSAAPAARVTFRSFEVWQRQADGAWKISRWIDGPTRPSTGRPSG